MDYSHPDETRFSDEVLADTIVYVTVTDGDDEFVY